MSGSTKILTVSYGTFSCTLEGFEDPLGSMREMAEYFRDLAADDRYFGAEPPTPDAEMLQRIAEKEVKRRVDAQMTETGVALVAAPAPTAVAPVAQSEPAVQEPAPAAKADPEAGPLTYDDEFTMSDEPDDVLTVDPNASPNGDGPAETVAEKLRRIRAVVSQNIDVNRDALRQEQEPNAADPNLRDRAITETIHQIQADLDEGEGAGTDDSIAKPAEKPTEVDQESPSIEDAGSTDDLEDDTSASASGNDEDFEPEAIDWDFEPELLKNSERPTSRSDSRVVSDVLEKVAQAPSDTSEAGERVTSRTLSPEPEKDVGRLLDETDTKLNDDETIRRRRVISQMRAAVAATKAERIVSRQESQTSKEEAEKDLYRGDLNDAVESQPARPKTSLPLVLVSSQRVDEDGANESSGNGGQKNLADFAADVGAKELPELMEAAAAFAVFTEGQTSFTRPEIMKMVTRMDPSLQLSREDSLRSFGQLLREGKFKKLERGQFTIAEETKYHPSQAADA
ncbi:MAG: hypothetical protein QNJ20_13665 [Paracoccaceae bacterium]|nr:hypothetical protein [Paracoccaceae bacterium]